MRGCGICEGVGHVRACMECVRAGNVCDFNVSSPDCHVLPCMKRVR